MPNAAEKKKSAQDADTRHVHSRFWLATPKMEDLRCFHWTCLYNESINLGHPWGRCQSKDSATVPTKLHHFFLDIAMHQMTTIGKDSSHRRAGGNIFNYPTKIPITPLLCTQPRCYSLVLWHKESENGLAALYLIAARQMTDCMHLHEISTNWSCSYPHHYHEVRE